MHVCIVMLYFSLTLYRLAIRQLFAVLMSHTVEFRCLWVTVTLTQSMVPDSYIYHAWEKHFQAKACMRASHENHTTYTPPHIYACTLLNSAVVTSIAGKQWQRWICCFCCHSSLTLFLLCQLLCQISECLGNIIKLSNFCCMVICNN